MISRESPWLPIGFRLISFRKIRFLSHCFGSVSLLAKSDLRGGMWRKIDGERREMWSQKSKKAETIITGTMLTALKEGKKKKEKKNVSKSLLAGCSSPYLPGFLHQICG